MDNTNEMSLTLGLAQQRYVQTTLANGIPSYDCGDKIAILLRGLSPEVVCQMADNVKGVPHGTHWHKYRNLQTFSGTHNLGAVRLNAGNIIRNALK